MSKVSIIGAYNTKFGNFVKKNKETGEIKDLKTFYELLIEAGQGAIKDAGIDPAEIDAVWFGSCSPSLFVNQEHLAPLGIEVSPDKLRFKPMYRVEGACASSSLAIYNAIYGIESGRFNNVLVIGIEKMNLLSTKDMMKALAASSYWPEEGGKGMSFPDLFAVYAKEYQKHYNISNEDLRLMFATISALNYKNAYENPLAHFGKGSPAEKYNLYTADAILSLDDKKNPVVSDPLRLHDCSLVTDGAAAVVLTKTENALKLKDKIVEIAGIGHTEERMPISKRKNMYELVAAKQAVKIALNEANILINDVDIAEVHDCFTINQILCTEALGVSKDGHAGYDYINGKFSAEDSFAINLSGGLKAKGHPVGATGASMHTLIYKQLIEESIGLTLKSKKPEIGITLNVGGSAATNAVSVLRRIK